jgi:ABC-type cobalamin/Fe3+-siderophores transport system ATPase subunit
MESDETETVELSLDTTGDASPVEVRLKPLTVILGTNGTGKSTLLRQMAGSENPRHGGGKLEAADFEPVTFVEGGRIANVPNNLRVGSHDSFDEGLSESWGNDIRRAKRGELRSRTNQIFDALRRETRKVKEQHSDQVNEAQRKGFEAPEREEPPLDRAFRLFSDIFPAIELKADSASNELKASKYGNTYDASGLSDGERQVLTLLADLAVHGAGEAVLVDEPELNLNSGLAIRVWETIEREVLTRSEETYFVYATHSLSFASRPAVDRVIVLDNRAKVAACVDSPSILLKNETITSEDYLGALTTIVATPTALITEGEDGSVDRTFYQWIIGKEWGRERNGVPVVPMQGSSSVRGVVKQEGVWDELRGSTRLVGITDRDYLSDSQLRDLEGENLVVLDLHEVESYFCLPRVLCDLAEERVVEDQPTEEDIEEKILEYAASEKVAVAAKRVSESTRLSLSVSVANEDLDEADSTEEVADMLSEAAEDNLEAAENRLGSDQTKDTFEQELHRLDEAIENRNVEEILKLCPGKELLKRLAHFAGCSSKDHIMRAAEEHLDPSDYPNLRGLRNELRTALDVTPSVPTS